MLKLNRLESEMNFELNFRTFKTMCHTERGGGGKDEMTF